MPLRRFIYESAQKPPATIPFVPATVLVTAFDAPAIPPRSARRVQRDDVAAPVFVPPTSATPAITSWWQQETQPGRQLQPRRTDQVAPVAPIPFVPATVLVTAFDAPVAPQRTMRVRQRDDVAAHVFVPITAAIPAITAWWQQEIKPGYEIQSRRMDQDGPAVVPSVVPALTTWWTQELRPASRNVRSVQNVHFGPVFTPVAIAAVFPTSYLQEAAPRARRRSGINDLLGFGWLNIQSPVSVFVHPSQIRMMVTQTAGFLFSPAQGITQLQIKASSTIGKITLPGITFKSFSITCTSSYIFKVVV